MSSNPDDADVSEESASPAEKWDEGDYSHEISEVPVQIIPCRRCGLTIDPGLTCPHCLAPSLIASSQGVQFQPEPDSFQIFKSVLIGYVLQVIPALCMGWVMLQGGLTNDENRKWWTLTLEGWDFLVVLCVFAWVGRVALGKPNKKVRFLTWLAMPVVLVGFLVLNHAYHLVLNEYLKVDVKGNFEWTPLWILMFALQPAIVEELFFRYLALGTMARIMNIHAAVLVSSALFALGHIYAPLSLPILFLAGLMLGYLRVGSGGLLLPMIAHFIHNLTVLWIEVSQ